MMRGPGLAMIALAAATACTKKAPTRERPPVPVAVATVHQAAVPIDLSANGIVSPIQTAQVSSQVDGIIQHVLFREGQDVTQGQVLFQIDPTAYRAAYAQAKANLARDIATMIYDQAEVVRYDSLVAKDYVTKEQADQERATAGSAVATVVADSALVASAKFNLDNSTIRAPISGRTGNLLVREGNLVHGASGTPLVLINQIHPIYVAFYVPSTSLADIQKYARAGAVPVTVYQTSAQAGPPGGPATGDAPQGTSVSRTPRAAAGGPPSARHHAPAGDPTTSGAAGGAGGGAGGGGTIAGGTGDQTSGDTTGMGGGGGGSGPPGGGVTDVADNSVPSGPGISGTLTFVNNAVDTATGTVLVKGTFANQQSELWPGEFVATSIRLSVQQNALVVPPAAIMTGQQGTYVFVVDPTANTVKQQTVVVGRTTSTVAVINSGLAAGDRVVTDGQSRLQNGAKVAVRAITTTASRASP
jgi:multidrug efflux pump subunit AcrA (membrane-fusion protein)